MTNQDFRVSFKFDAYCRIYTSILTLISAIDQYWLIISANWCIGGKSALPLPVYLPHVPPHWLHRMSSSLPRLVLWESEGLVAYLHPRPWTPGSVVLERSTPGSLGGSIFSLEKQEFVSWLLGARAVSELLCERLKVRRCALVCRPHKDTPAQVRLSLTREWTDRLFSTTNAWKVFYYCF